MKKSVIIVLCALIIVLILLVSSFLWNNTSTQKSITDFESCIAAGYPALESYPRQCKTPQGATFTEQLNSTVGNACTTDEQCMLPMQYAIRSVCPFASYCHQGSCIVACPQSFPEPAQCTESSECNCSNYPASDIKECACVSGKCVAIVERFK